jgi:hypothetical protein
MLIVPTRRSVQLFHLIGYLDVDMVMRERPIPVVARSNIFKWCKPCAFGVLCKIFVQQLRVLFGANQLLSHISPIKLMSLSQSPHVLPTFAGCFPSPAMLSLNKVLGHKPFDLLAVATTINTVVNDQQGVAPFLRHVVVIHGDGTAGSPVKFAAIGKQMEGERDE